MDTNCPIGFFDSGVGGLSVYSLFKKILPYENTLYFGDLKNMPYGNKSKTELLQFARMILDFFKEQNVKAVVIACNTSSANVYDIVKSEYDFKIYPIIQSCAKVISNMNFKKIGVFATVATINSGAYKSEIQKYNPNISVVEQSCPKWTNFVEGGQIYSEECLSNIKTQLDKMMCYNPERIILGCTHYPFLKPVLTKFADEKVFIDPSEIFVKFIFDDLKKSNMQRISKEMGTEKFFVSANPENFVNNASLFYKVNKLPSIV